MTILWLILAFIAGTLFGAVAMSLFIAGNRNGDESLNGGLKSLIMSIIRRYERFVYAHFQRAGAVCCLPNINLHGLPSSHSVAWVIVPMSGTPAGSSNAEACWIENKSMLY